MDFARVKSKVAANEYLYSQHSDVERKIEGLTFAQIEEALLSGRALERYADTGRGESCLIAGMAGAVPVHIVAGWRGEKLVIITVYIPRPPKFLDPWTRAPKTE